jgi:hypothetical protein
LHEQWYETGQAKQKQLYELGSLIEEMEWDENGLLIKQYQIDRRGEKYRRLELYRATEDKRVERLQARFADPSTG